MAHTHLKDNNDKFCFIKCSYKIITGTHAHKYVGQVNDVTCVITGEPGSRCSQCIIVVEQHVGEDSSKDDDDCVVEDAETDDSLPNVTVVRRRINNDVTSSVQ